ncbi:MAG: hypothetical protein ACYC96_16315 [Fimbriimonadaceae bacterium]
MGKISYDSAGGELYGASTNGVATTYMTNALGSTIGTITSAGVRNRYTYSPYGLLTSKTGADPDPRFLWNAESGSRATTRQHAENYNQRRHYSSSDAGWTSRDLLWPLQRPYGFVKARPTTLIEPFGLTAQCPGAPPPNNSFFSACVYALCAAAYSYDLFNAPGEVATAPIEIAEPIETDGGLETSGSVYSHYDAGQSICEARNNLLKSPYCDCLENAPGNAGDLKSRSIYWICSTQSGKHGGCANAPGFMDCWACCMDKFSDTAFDFCKCERETCCAGTGDYSCSNYGNYDQLCDNSGSNWPGGWK